MGTCAFTSQPLTEIGLLQSVSETRHSAPSVFCSRIYAGSKTSARRLSHRVRDARGSQGENSWALAGAFLTSLVGARRISRSAGGFGTSTASSTRKKQSESGGVSKSKSPKPPQAGSARKVPPMPSSQDLTAFSNKVLRSLDSHMDDMIRGLQEKGWWASDAAVLPERLRKEMRAEVEELWHAGHFKQSQSIRGGTEYYDKKHVFATEIDGTTYERAPRMAHYTVSLTRELAKRINEAFPDLNLDTKFIGNKLNMSVGSGATFDPHLDVGVAEKPFNRKLSLLFYLNSDWRPELGGEISLLGEGATEEEAAVHPNTKANGLPVTLSPISGRWIAFWSEKILHKVRASGPVKGIDDYRVSYVIWFVSKDNDQGQQDSSGSGPDVKPAGGGIERAPSFAM